MIPAALFALPFVFALAILYGATSTGEIFVSEDGGSRWTVRSASPLSDVAAIAPRPTGTITLVSAAGVVFGSDSAGAHWTAHGDLGFSQVADIAIERQGALVVVTQGGVCLRSYDDGLSWYVVGVAGVADAVSLTPLVDDRLLILTRTGLVLESANGGASWTAAAALSVPHARVVRALGENVFVITDEGDVYRSLDGRQPFHAVGAISQIGIVGAALTNAGMAVITQEGHLAVSEVGTTWTWRGSLSQVWVTAFASDVTIGTSVPSGDLTTVLRLGPPIPNPARGRGSVTFSVTSPREATVWLELYDLRGRRLATRTPSVLQAESVQDLLWQLPGVATGTYFARLRDSHGNHASVPLALIE
jgi:photosystem II stability/assembly factor-like uncharacterized protein